MAPSLRSSVPVPSEWTWCQRTVVHGHREQLSSSCILDVFFGGGDGGRVQCIKKWAGDIVFNIYLTILDLSCSEWGLWSFSCSVQTLSCSRQDPVLWPRMEPGPPVLEAGSLSHWTIREVPRLLLMETVFQAFIQFGDYSWWIRILSSH